jgi:Transcriptional regulatory protein, C terminal.
MNYELYGYLIGKDFHFDIENKCLYRLTTSGTEKNLIFGAMHFNDTMLNLFLYLLSNGRGKNVSKDELLKYIWEENNLSPSTQRLWQVYTSLNKKIEALGVPEGFIQYSKSTGYTIAYNDITPLYYKG